MTEYYQVWISAETEKDAKDILNKLVRLKLIVGGTVLNGPSRYWWKEKEIDMSYFFIMGFTIDKHRKNIEEEYSKISKEEVPMMSFIKMDGNEKFLNYIYYNIR